LKESSKPGQYILILAKTDYQKTPYDSWLAGTGITPIILTTEEFAPGYQHMEYVQQFANYDRSQLVEKVAYKLGREFDLVGIFARGESDIIRAARLRERLGLPGQKMESALAYRDKLVMKDHLRGKGVRLPTYQPVNSVVDIVDFIERNGYPVVIKPLSESGSFNVCIVGDEQALDAYLANPPQASMEIETFVEGKMYHVDGLMIDDKNVFVRPFQYVNDCLSFRKNEYIGNSILPPEHPLYDRLVAAVRQVIANLPATSHMAFHAEFWHTPDDEIVFCEIAGRTGGGMISMTVEQVLGFSIDKEWLLAECGITRSYPQLPPTMGGCICIPPLSGVLDAIPSETKLDCIIGEKFTGKVGERYHGGVKSGLFLMGYVVSGDSESEVIENITKTAEWFYANSRWSP
jgi:hypothetical protein